MKSMLKSLMSVAAAALALTSCSTDATDEVIAKGELKTLKVNATIEQTRTTLADNHVNLAWSDGDQILLYIGEKLTKANRIKHTIGADDIKVEYKEGDVVYANYSLMNDDYSNGATLAEIYIQNNQKQSEPSVFAGQNLPMVATGAINGDKVNLTFQPVGCVLVFNVYGPAGNEKIQSIKFESSTACSGFDNCDLTAGVTAEAIGYAATKTSATVTLDTSAPIGTAKPTDTKTGSGNQVYLVVAQKEYPAGSKFTVTTDAGSYTFTTTTALDCSNTARVVNLNVKNATAGFSPEIIVPTVGEQSSDANNNLLIDGIKFKNITADQINKAEVGVFSDKELTKQDVDWLSFENTATLSSGQLYGVLAANAKTTPRTAYIGIKCVEGAQVVAQAAIAITQVGAGSKPAETITASLTVEDIAKLSLISNQYKEFSITAKDGSAWTGYSAGTATYLQLGWNTTPSKGAAKSHVLVPNADKVIKKITFTPNSTTDRVLVLLPEDFEYTGQSANVVKDAAYASVNTNGSTEPISIDLTGKNLKRFMIRVVGGAVQLSNITVEYE